METTKQKSVVLGLLLVILISAFALRIAKIETIPSSIYPDEAMNGIDAQEANATGNYKLFYENNQGREGLFINLQALTIKTLGNNALGLKLWSIIFGTLTVLGVFLLTSEIFQNKLAGLTGAYLTAFSYWAINFSRIGFRAIMVPFILVFSFYFLFRGLRTKKLHDFVLAGLIYGLGVHTYIAFRVSPLILVVVLFSLVLTRQDFLKNYWKHILVFAVSLMITAAPMLNDFFRTHPEHYASRTGSISVLNPESNQGNLLSTITKTFSLSLAKYNLWGDQNMRHNYPPYPILNPLTGVAFLFGFLFTIFQFFKLLWLRLRRGIRDEKFDVYVFLLVWFFTLLIPEFLANEGNPHALRAIGTLPVVMILAAIPFLWIFKKINTFGHGFKLALISLLIFIFGFIAIFDPVKYFVFFANSPKQHQAFDANLREISKFLQTRPSSQKKYVVTGNVQRATVQFLNPTMPNLEFFHPSNINQIQPAPGEKFVIIFSGAEWEAINSLRNRIPNLTFEERTNKFQDTFYILK